MVNARDELKEITRRNYPELKREEYLRLDLSENINGLPADFIASVLSGFDAGFFSMYPAYHNLERAIAKHVGLTPEHIYVSNSSDAAIRDIFTAYVSAGDTVIFSDPTFEMCFIYTKIIGAKTIVVPYTDQLKFDTEKYLAGLTKKVKLAFLVNPNNPIGNYIDASDIVRIIKKAQTTNTLVLIDEAYFYFCDKTFMDEVKNYEHVVIVRTFSKFMGLAAVRLGYAVAAVEVITNIKKVRPTFDINAVAARFVEKLLGSPEIIKKMQDQYKEGRRYILKMLDDHQIEYYPTDCNLLLLRCDDAVEPIMEALKKEKILTRGLFRQLFLKPYLRINIGGKAEMERFFKAFHPLWKKHVKIGVKL